MTHQIQAKQRLAQSSRNAIAVAVAVVILSACSLTPIENRPSMEIPLKFVESEDRTFSQLMPSEDTGRWQPAEPADEQRPSPWWNVFGDPVLVQLEEEALKANPDVSIAMARLKQARALTSRSESARFPEVDAGFGPTRQRITGAAAGRGDGAPGATQTLWRAQASVAYEVDIFGSVSSGVEAARADAAQQQALAHQMLLLVQADVARTYFSLRQLEGERRLLKDTVKLREDAVALLERKLSVGAVARYTIDQAMAELFSARSEQLAVEQQHALTSHALAVLLGKAPAMFTLEAIPLENITVQLPPGMPSTLLERRPDIAAAERAMAAENARIGIAKAAFFPSVSLTGSFGYESAELRNLTNWTQRTFLLGPLVGTVLSMPIFDGGRRKADVARARAVYEERVAEYRKTVLQAFREVEDSLASMRMLDERIVHQRKVEESSSRVAQSATARFVEGDVDYLIVVDAERTLLRSRQSLIQSEGERARATVDLVRALGGGWEVSRTEKVGPNG